MHPYRMQQLIKERGKDKVINVQRRASLYQTINQLKHAGLIRIRETLRQENRPERTIYELTDKGEQTALDWMREILSMLTQEFPEFPAAVSFLGLLTPADALRQLEMRESALANRIADIDSELRRVGTALPRLFLLEEELIRATLDAELKWTRSIIADLGSGQLTWNQEWRQPFGPSETEESTTITREDG
jgi:DNA-binding PadR family transcriptional regulator